MARSVIKNIDKVIGQMKSLSSKAEKAIIQLTEDNAQEIVLKAKIAAPVNKNPNITGGSLRQGIANEKVEGKIKQIIFAREKYSAYMEFGTGGLVSVPSELKEMASQFKGKGIKKINLQPQPFLYPAFVKGREQYLKDLKDNLKVLIERNG
jgi:HK97 gp10 family phage protein|tara:strand:- start:941 stop:1393 length:453 start_codon:yes stop_codon:yes gene_type:complete